MVTTHAASAYTAPSPLTVLYINIPRNNNAQNQCTFSNSSCSNIIQLHNSTYSIRKNKTAGSKATPLSFLLHMNCTAPCATFLHHAPRE